MERTPEIITAAGVAIASLIVAVNKWRGRNMTHEERGDDREIALLIAHIDQLKTMWEESLLKLEALQKDNDCLRTQVQRLTAKVMHLEEHEDDKK